MYKATIEKASKELTAREKLQAKNVRTASQIDELSKSADPTFTPLWYAILNIENDESDNKEYQNIIISTSDKGLLYTGSDSFITSFCEIFDTMKEESDEEFSIRVSRIKSKNFNGDYLFADII